MRGNVDTVTAQCDSEVRLFLGFGVVRGGCIRKGHLESWKDLRRRRNGKVTLDPQRILHSGANVDSRC